MCWELFNTIHTVSDDQALFDGSAYVLVFGSVRVAYADTVVREEG